MKRFKRAADIKVGVIGYGGAFNMGRAHLNEMKRAGMKPTAVADVDRSRLKVAEEDFPGIETYDSAEAMLKTAEGFGDLTMAGICRKYIRKIERGEY